MNISLYKKIGVLLLMVLFVLIGGCSRENTNIMTEQEENLNGTVTLILEDQKSDIQCFSKDGGVYLPLAAVQEMFNKSFYWDEKEGVLSYVVPKEVWRIYANEPYYHIGNGVKGFDAVALLLKDGTPYISTELIEKVSDVQMHFYEKPDRLVVNYTWEEYLEYSVTGEGAYLHVEPDLSSECVVLCEPDSKLHYISGTGKSGKEFVKVMTPDGLYGYVQLKHLSESYYNHVCSTYVEPTWDYCLMDEAIKLGWHQISSAAGNSTYETAVSKADGMNVISPTWYRLADVEGTIESIADIEYVQKAHNDGYKVWPLLDNFADNVSTLQPLSSTKTREIMINNLISETLRIGADGINVDFEAISRETGVHFVQFIKELAVEAHKHGLIISVDNYVPSAYRAYYDLESQGKFADYVILMAYDEHYAGSQEAGSVSSIGYVQKAVTDCLTMVKKEHIVVALPFYTRIWMEAKSGVTSEARSMNGANSFIVDNNLKTRWDSETGQNYAECVISGVTYKVWLEDIQSLSYKLQVVASGDVAGAAFWRLGQEADGIWEIINQHIK